MKRFKIMAAAMAAVLAVTMSGCGSTGAATEETTEEAVTAVTTVEEPVETPAEEEGQNPVMNYAGAYSDESGKGYSLLIEPTDATDGVYITIGHNHDDAYDIWEIYGSIKDNVIAYSNGAKITMSPNPESETGIDQVTAYTDGTGTFEITQESKITWKDDKENAGDGLVFVWDQELNDQVQEMTEANADEDTTGTALSAMNWEGPYVDANSDNMSMEITAEGGSANGTFNIMKKGEGSNAETWTMTGSFDTDNGTITYKDCVKKEVTLDESGNIASESVVYEDGTGSFSFDPESQTVTWQDDKEDAGSGVMFIFNFNANGGEAGDEAEIMEGEIIDGTGENIPEEEVTEEEDVVVDFDEQEEY